MDDDATTQEDTSPDAEGTPETGSPEQTGTDPAAQIASYRKRQAGAEAARQAEKARADSLEARVKAYENAARAAETGEAADAARLQERLDAAERRAAEAEAKAEARILDVKFPNARKELPEVTDEVKLAKFEAMLKEDEEPAAPTPRGVNGPKAAGGTSVKKETIADVEAQLRAMPIPWD